MRFPSFTSLMKLLTLRKPLPVAPLVPTAAAALNVRPIIECAFIEVEAATATVPAAETLPADTSPTPRADADGSLPSAGHVEEPAERSLMASIAAHAAITAVAMPRREPEDFILARRLEVVARMNRPVAQVAGTTVRKDAGPRLKKSRPGTLSPVLARGTRPAFSTPIAAAA